MSFNYMPASATTNIVQISGTPTTLLKASANATNTTATIATVTAGKTAYLIGFTLSTGSTSGSTISSIKDDLGGVYARIIHTSNGQQSITWAAPMGYGLPLAATKLFQVTSDNAVCSAYATIYYIEV